MSNIVRPWFAFSVALFTAIISIPPALSGQQRTGLKIVVIAGEDAVNIVQQKTAVAPIVEVRDRNDLPVPGATVTFAVGQGATFGGGSTITMLTNAAGQATAAGLTPTAAGAIQIQATAVFQGQTAVATIAQSNVLTAAQAAAAGTSSTATTGGGGAGISGTTVGLAVGAVGAAAGAVLALDRDQPQNSGPVASVTPAAGVLDVTEFVFTVLMPGASTAVWDFGDGVTQTGETVRHVFTREGSFRVVMRAEGSAIERYSTVVRIGTLTGTWTATRSEGTYTAVLTQSGSSLVGRFVIDTFILQLGKIDRNDPMDGNLSSPLGVRLFQRAECNRIITGTLDGALNTFVAQESFPTGINCVGGTLTFVRR